MNKTKIEWCDSTWNPVTGCRHGCPYCYAQRIAKRYGGWTTSGKKTTDNFFKDPPELQGPLLLKRNDGKVVNAPYPFGFTPTFHRYRLDEPSKKTKGQTIFVCSMADLFGRWVPTRWIVEVLDACRKAPQHRYLFLTKNPKRYIELDSMALLPHEDNFWFGSTVTKGEDPATWMENIGCHWFISVEPLLGPVDLTGRHRSHAGVGHHRSRDWKPEGKGGAGLRVGPQDCVRLQDLRCSGVHEGQHEGHLAGQPADGVPLGLHLPRSATTQSTSWGKVLHGMWNGLPPER